MAVIKVSDKSISDGIKIFIEAFEAKRKKKGNDSWNSPLEGWGKLQEELFEATMELHDKNWKKFETEQLDAMVVILWNIISARENNLL